MPGKTPSLFGTHRAAVLEMSGQKLAEVRDLVRQVSTREEFVQYSDAVSAHAAEFPMTNVGMVRVSLATNPVACRTAAAYHWRPLARQPKQ